MSDIFKLLDEGRDAFGKGDYFSAKKIFLEVIENNDGFADVYNSLGLICFLDDEYRSSILFYKKAVEINPFYSEALMNLVVVMHQTGNINDAEIYMKQLKQIKSVQGTADRHCLGKLANKHAETAEIYKSMFMYDGAIEEYQKALELSPEFPDIRLNYAITLRDAGRIEDAIYEFDKILIQKPQYMVAYVHLGICYYKIGYIGFAINAWKKGYELNPKDRVLKSFLFVLNNVEEIN